MTGERFTLVVQDAAKRPGTPRRAVLERCARHAFGADVEGELVIRIVAEAESADLNQRYRGKAGPTNVLAFPPAEVPVAPGELLPLGDIVVCAAVVAREAEAQGKPAAAHWAHMIVHACLHLQGFDHLDAGEAAAMEARESELLAGLGIADPYGATA